MRILVTAGPTREYIDSVRFITNASSGRMGFAVAEAAVRAGHDVTLLAGPVRLDPPEGCRIERFVSVADLKDALGRHFAACDVLVMAAAVGDFRPDKIFPGKIHRSDAPLSLRLLATEDVLASVARGKRPDQRIIAFAVEAGPDDLIEAKARREMAAKSADYVVVYAPDAIAASASRACVVTPDATALGWARRSKADLAREIVRLLAPCRD